MVQPTQQHTDSGTKHEERYTHGYSSGVVQYLADRTAVREAAFFLPHLCPGISLLDCGCGPGTITVDLAEVVTPGKGSGY